MINSETTTLYVNFSVNQIVSEKRAITNKQNRLANLVLIGLKMRKNSEFVHGSGELGPHFLC